MRIAIRYAVVPGMFGVLLACAQPGDELSRQSQQPAAAPATVCTPGVDCPPAKPTPVRDTRPMQPAVPPVPDSPLKIDCARLPTQVERDTCTNRKLSTG